MSDPICQDCFPFPTVNHADCPQFLCTNNVFHSWWTGSNIQLKNIFDFEMKLFYFIIHTGMSPLACVITLMQMSRTPPLISEFKKDPSYSEAS